MLYETNYIAVPENADRYYFIADYFAYFRGSGRGNTETAVLRSEPITSSDITCLRFFAHMYGKRIGSLVVNKASALGKTELMKLSGNQKRRWFEVEVNIPADTNYKVCFSFYLRIMKIFIFSYCLAIASCL